MCRLSLSQITKEMTLVIANRKGNWISFASDSRISFTNQGHVDIGIKIFSNPTKVSSMTDGQTNK